MHVQRDIGICRYKSFYCVRQHIACLCMGCREGQGPPIGITMVFCNTPDVLDFAQDSPGNLYYRSTGSGHFDKMLAVALKNLHAELILELTDLFADPGLGRVEGFRRRRDVEPVAGNLPDVA